MKCLLVGLSGSPCPCRAVKLSHVELARAIALRYLRTYVRYVLTNAELLKLSHVELARAIALRYLRTYVRYVLTHAELLKLSHVELARAILIVLIEYVDERAYTVSGGRVAHGPQEELQCGASRPPLLWCERGEIKGWGKAKGW